MKRALFLFFLLTQHPVLFSQNWVPLDQGIECFYNADVKDMCVDSTNDLLRVSGMFNQDGNCVAMRGIAQWNGTEWDSIGIGEGNAVKYGIYQYHDTLLVYGNFTDSNIIFYWAKWNGTSLDSIPGGPNAGVMCYAERGDSLFLGGWFDHCGSDSTFLLAVYDGQQINGISQYCGIQGGWVINAMTFYNNNLYVGGNFDTWPSTLAINDFGMWNGSDSILPVLPIFEQAPCLIEDMIVYQNELYISGWFRQQDGFPSSYIMKYDGQQLTSVGGGANERVTAMKIHNGELYIGGYFSQVGNVQSKHVAKWNGSQWFSLSTDSLTGSYPLVQDIDFYRDSLIISGNFRAINGDSSMQRIAKYNHALIIGVPEQLTQIQVSAAPNPSCDMLEFRFSSEGMRTIFIFDCFGKEVYRKESSESQTELSVERLSTGLYFYRIEQEGMNAATGKLIVEH